MATEANTKVITPEMILSYPHFDEPQPDDSGKLWYNAVLIAPAGTDLSALKAAVMDCAKAQFGEKAASMFADELLKSPFRKDWKKKGYPEGSTFFSCKSKVKPGIVGLAPGKDGKPAPYTGEIYAGLIVRASIRPYYYKQQGGGIAMGLGNVQVIRHGERLDSRLPAEDEFEADANAAAAAGNADLDDLL